MGQHCYARQTTVGLSWNKCSNCVRWYTSTSSSSLDIGPYFAMHAFLRCFQSRDPCVLLRAFKVYVRPILEYNTTVWSPSQKKDIEAIEKVRRFTKRLSGLSDYSYSERLRKLNIQSLELRRIHYDLTLTYQIGHVSYIRIYLCYFCFRWKTVSLIQASLQYL